MKTILPTITIAAAILSSASGLTEDDYIHIPNTYCQYYESGGDGNCGDGQSFEDVWEQCLYDGKQCMGVMWNSCEGGTSDITVNGAWKLMNEGQIVGDAEHPTATCGGKDQALGHWDVFLKAPPPPPTPPNTLQVQGTLEDGKVAIFSVDEINSVLGENNYATVPDGQNIFDQMDIKGNQGFVLRAENTRTEKVGGLLVWANSTTAFGTWNPREYSKANDWEKYDMVPLIDYIAFHVHTVVRVPDDTDVTISTNTYNTGWNLPAEAIRFGQCGLVGGWWNEMEIEYELEEAMPVVGIWSDSVELPYTIKYESLISGDWVVHKESNFGNHLFDGPLYAKKWRLNWNSTDLFETQGLSTYRSGGGLHAELMVLDGIENKFNNNCNDDGATLKPSVSPTLEPSVSLTLAPSASPVETQCSAGEIEVLVSVTTDYWPNENSWTIDSSTLDAAVGSAGPFDSRSSTYSEDLCLDESMCYTFTILDSWGDGIYSDGDFSLIVNGSVILTNQIDIWSSLDKTFGNC
jgi:hypothetical protein